MGTFCKIIPLHSFDLISDLFEKHWQDCANLADISPSSCNDPLASVNDSLRSWNAPEHSNHSGTRVSYRMLTVSQCREVKDQLGWGKLYMGSRRKCALEEWRGNREMSCWAVMLQRPLKILVVREMSSESGWMVPEERALLLVCHLSYRPDNVSLTRLIDPSKLFPDSLALSLLSAAKFRGSIPFLSPSYYSIVLEFR